MSDSSGWWMLLRTLASLGAVLALIYALAWFIKRYLRPEQWATGRSLSEMKVIQSLSLEPKKKLMIVEVRNQELLLGISDLSIQLICPLEKKHEEVPHA